MLFTAILRVSFATISASFLSSTTLGSATVRAETTLKVTVSIVTMDTTDSLQIQFDTTRTHFNIGGSTVTWVNNPTTWANTGAAPGVTWTCSYSSASDLLTITSSGTVSFCTGLVFQFSNFINAPYTKLETATGKSVATSGIQSTRSISISYTALTMNSVVLDPQSLVVADTNKLKVTFTVGTFDITSSFSVIMTFPARYSTTLPYFTGGLTCSNGTTNIATSPTCSVTNDGSNTGTIRITSLYTTTISSSSSAAFLIANMIGPVSTATVSGITMTLVDPASDSYVIATKTGITMAVTTAKTATFTINFNSPSTIGVYSTANAYMELLITPGVYVAAGCKATIVFPSEITYQSTLAFIGFVSSMDYTTGTSTLANTVTSYCTESATETGTIDPYIKVK